MINFPQEGVSRRISGYSPTTHGRRDFVELSGTESGTALAAQVRIHDHTHVYKMFVYVHLCTYTNTHDVRFTVLVYVLACTYTKCLYTRPFVRIRLIDFTCVNALVGQHVRRNFWFRRYDSRNSHA